MAHYAYVNDSNIVTDVIVGKNENELIDGLTPEEYYAKGTSCQVIRTSYNSKIRFNYAGVGFTYDPIDDAFIPPAPCEHDELILSNDKKWQCSNAQHISPIV